VPHVNDTYNEARLRLVNAKGGLECIRLTPKDPPGQKLLLSDSVKCSGIEHRPLAIVAMMLEASDLE
jgi:hypothetical protein